MEVPLLDLVEEQRGSGGTEQARYRRPVHAGAGGGWVQLRLALVFGGVGLVAAQAIGTIGHFMGAIFPELDTSSSSA